MVPNTSDIKSNIYLEYRFQWNLYSYNYVTKFDPSNVLNQCLINLGHFPNNECMQCLPFREIILELLPFMTHLSKVFSPSDWRKLLIGGPSKVKFKGLEKKVLTDRRPTNLGYHISRLYCTIVKLKTMRNMIDQEKDSIYRISNISHARDKMETLLQ